MYLHFTGYLLINHTFPKSIFPYTLSTESSFYYKMLSTYYTNRKKPWEHHGYVFNSLLMGYSDYYSQIEPSINFLFFNNLKNSKYFAKLETNICFLNS